MFKVEGLYKTFEAHSANEVHAINGVDLVINDGDFITVIGSNGAGKSTLLNLLSGSTIADSGKIYLDDLDVTKMPEYKRAKYVGRVFQDPRVGTCPDLLQTVQDIEDESIGLIDPDEVQAVVFTYGGKEYLYTIPKSN